jgi:protein O-GlcNAc transferase
MNEVYLFGIWLFPKSTMMSLKYDPPKLLLYLLIWLIVSLKCTSVHTHGKPDGPASWERGQALFREREYDAAAMELWTAVLFHGDTEPERQYDVQAVFQMFIDCYIVQDKLADGLAFVSSESFRRGQTEMGDNYLQQALAVDPKNKAALAIQREYRPSNARKATTASTPSPNDKANNDKEFVGKTPEHLYELASRHFSEKRYEECADIFELSCIRSNHRLGPSCSSAVYCRNLIVDYGFNGTQFDRDMERLRLLIESETILYRASIIDALSQDEIFSWSRPSSVHPHMMLGYPLDPKLKRYVAESVAFLDEQMARAAKINTDGTLPPLPIDMPYSVDAARTRFATEATNSDNFRIRVGFVGSGFNSKAVLFLSQDMFRFFDRSRFEIHIFSFGPADNAMFITHGMRGVDWRERVKSNVDVFHDCLAMNLSMDHIKAAQYIHEQNVHILIEWDGYARQGERAQGLFALRPAPIQILHQEYLGTSGAKYVDYLFTDEIASPLDKAHLYTEKLIWMPNHFFSKGHALQKEVKKPTFDYSAKSSPYKVGTGSPKENRCLAPSNVGPKEVSFVFCNFNKLLKANPDTIRSWIRILREVPNSILCLLENPVTAIPYVRKFVHETAGSSLNNSDPTTFLPGDGDSLNSRIHFLPWERNPFDHQMRSQDFCNVMLDSYPYNGHTVAQDALYGGVPIVTRSDGDDMSSRVTTSANIVLGLSRLNAYDGSRQYEDIAIEIGSNETFYRESRKTLIDSCLQRNPMHPYWDVARYVKNFESGLSSAWTTFVNGKSPQHIRIQESIEASLGTYDEEIFALRPEGKYSTTA